MIRKDECNGTYARKRLSDAIQNIVPDSIHQMEQLFSLSHSTQVLFAEYVILAEGKTERRLLPFLFKKITGRTMGQEKYALIAQTGVNDTKKSMEILQAMSIPSKAIADLDYGLTGAIKHGFIDANDIDVIEIKNIFKLLSDQGKITLNGNGVPKNGIVDASKAYELISNESSAIPHIKALHVKMKEKGIWLWESGAIEAHIGITNKDEKSWAKFKKDIANNGLQQTCSDYKSIINLIQWLRNQ